MNKMAGLVSSIVLGALVFTSGQAAALVAESTAAVIAGEIGDRTVGSIVNNVRLAGVSLIDQATQSGNAMISRASNEASVLASNLDIIFKENMNETFNRLSDERKALLIEAEAMRRSLTSIKDASYELKDSVALDLNALATSLPFVKKRFFVQSVRGLAFLPQEADFKFQIAATTLGIQDDASTSLEVFRGHGSGKALLSEVVVDQTRQRFFADVSIPNAALAPSFKESELSIVPLTVRFNTMQKRGWGIFSYSEKATHDVPIFLTFLPRRAGTLISVVKSPTYAWVSAGTKSKTYGTPNRHCERRCGGEPTRGSNSIEIAVPGGTPPYKVGYQRMTNPRQRCIGGNCAFSDSFNLRITDNETRLVFTWDTWSTSGTWEASADVLEYQVNGEATAKSDAVPVPFGKILEIMVPKSATYGVIQVRTFTKQTYEVTIGQPDSRGLITYEGKTSAGPELDRITYRVNDPAVVSTTKF